MTGDSPQDSQEPEAEHSPTGGVDARPKKTEKGPVAKVAPGPSKEKLKAGTSGFAGDWGKVGVGVWVWISMRSRSWAGSLDLGGGGDRVIWVPACVVSRCHRQ